MKNFLYRFVKLRRTIYRNYLRVIGTSDKKTTRSLFAIAQAGFYALGFFLLINLVALFADNLLFGGVGDLIGQMLNPFLTFLMLLGLLITIVVQRSELSLARKEFKRSADALHEQKDNLKRQSFEDTFFNMMGLYNEVINSVGYYPVTFEAQGGQLEASNKIEGRLALAKFYHDWNDLLQQAYEENQETDNKQVAIATFAVFYEHRSNSIGHYLRTVYQILKLVYFSTIVIKDKQYYVDILKSQLSSMELSLLFYHCTIGWGDDDFLHLAEHYRLFEHLHSESLVLISDAEFLQSA